MILGYALFIAAPRNLSVVLVALILFYLPAQTIQMTAILTMTDSIEYGQLKTGQRNEAVTLSVRPMLDKIAGAFSNGIVGFVAVALDGGIGFRRGYDECEHPYVHHFGRTLCRPPALCSA